MSNIIGNGQNQVPTNGDLGGMAYQDPRYVAVGNITVNNTLTLVSVLQLANLTTTQITGIATTAPGMTVYNYTTGNIQVYTGSKWGNVTVS